MRVCIEKSTGKLIESQSGGEVDRLPQTEKMSDEEYVEYLTACDDLEAGRLNTLKQNALNAGYAEADIEASYITEEEFAVIMEAMKPIPTYADLRKAEYPTYADYLDGIVKGDQDQIDKYIADCLAIKEKYPK